MAPPQILSEQSRRRSWLATTALLACAGMLATSFFLPYGELRLVGPKRATDTHLVFYLDHVDGPLSAVLASAGKLDEGQLRELVELERSLAIAMATVICLLLVAATFVRNRWAALLCLPALAFPAVVLADAQRWMQPIVAQLTGGTETSSMARSLLSQRLVAGEAVVETGPGAGLWLATAASLAALGGLWLHRRAYKPARPEPLEEPRRSAAL